jgi:pyruvate/2-oxoglutarate dehydrogenase complex dihydrolipoamide dehydrogenase (E3) component
VLSIAAQCLPDKIEEVKDEQALLASGSDPRITFEAAAKIYLERVKSSPDYKPKRKLLVGGQGITLEEFLVKTASYWLR